MATLVDPRNSMVARELHRHLNIKSLDRWHTVPTAQTTRSAGRAGQAPSSVARSSRRAAGGCRRTA
jgi:hypothetical protein